MESRSFWSAFYFCFFNSISFMPTYKETLHYLYESLPMYQRVGAIAYKADLTNTIALCAAIGNPQNKFRSVHVAGTNGKGSSSHMLAAVLQTAGYKTGLYTSPHLKEFTERIKIDGVEVSKDFVVDFVERIRPSIDEIKPSFFEITVAMAFEYFATQQVDIAIIEVGLGGRLDSTNVITPLVSLITNISWDHQDLLGDTLPKIAFEKAGIIKSNVPVVISERNMEVDSVFIKKAKEEICSIQFAQDNWNVKSLVNGRYEVTHQSFIQSYQLDLKGDYQRKNLAGVLNVVEILRSENYEIGQDHVTHALQSVTAITGLKGRWQKLGERPLVICDTGHNEGGIREVVKQIDAQEFENLLIVLGCVKDKELSPILSQLPKRAYYYFCQAQIPRALDAHELQKRANFFNLIGEVVKDVNQAVEMAKRQSGPNDFIFIGGSTFAVAEITNL
jgi:dihydrofolate synthase / folylpolyglutamate synthase